MKVHILRKSMPYHGTAVPIDLSLLTGHYNTVGYTSTVVLVLICTCTLRKWLYLEGYFFLAVVSQATAIFYIFAHFPLFSQQRRISITSITNEAHGKMLVSENINNIYLEPLTFQHEIKGKQTAENPREPKNRG